MVVQIDGIQVSEHLVLVATLGIAEKVCNLFLYRLSEQARTPLRNLSVS